MCPEVSFQTSTARVSDFFTLLRLTNVEVFVKRMILKNNFYLA
jgi:hypothetical protein